MQFRHQAPSLDFIYSWWRLHAFFMLSILSSTDEGVVVLSTNPRITMATPVTDGDLELNLLRTFLAVVRHGSLSKTATAIDKTQPAVSQQMLRLENIIGQRLFFRGRNGITLTRHGELLVSYANRALDLNEETLARLRTE